MLLIRLDDSRVNNTEGELSLVLFKIHFLFLFIIGKLYYEDFRFRSLYYSKKKISKCSPRLGNHGKICLTHKNNLISISGLSIFFFGIWYTLSSEISDLLLLSEVKGKNSFLNYKMQACLLVEVIEPALVYL